MKAQNLTISVPDKGCDKNCPYCISKITWSPKVDENTMGRNAEKVYKLAQTANVTSVLITGKAEPMLNSDAVMKWCKIFREWPLEIQTNGKKLMRMYRETQSPEPFLHMRNWGINVFAFSVDGLEQLEEYSPMFAAIADHGMIVRVCINLTSMIGYDFHAIIEAVMKAGNVRQVLFRNITYPRMGQWLSKAEPPEIRWIKSMTKPAAYWEMAHNFGQMMEKTPRLPFRILPETGVKVYDFMGTSVCFSDYCIQQENRMEDIRSLIFHQDGHVYTSWDSPASLLF